MKSLQFTFKFAVLSIALISCSTAFADAKFQAGDIEKGLKWPISVSTGEASYYATGREGIVQFTCDLQGEVDDYCGNAGLNAYLRTGKNFTNINNPLVVPLHAGINGPFNWQLTNNNAEDNVGNIRVRFACGKNVTIQCVGKKV